MQKKVVKVNLNFVKELTTLYDKAYNDYVQIGGNIFDACRQVEKELMKLKGVSTKEVIKKIDEYEAASKQYGFPFESQFQRIRDKAMASDKGVDKAFSKMIQDINALQTELGAFLDKV